MTNIRSVFITSLVPFSPKGDTLISCKITHVDGSTSTKRVKIDTLKIKFWEYINHDQQIELDSPRVFSDTVLGGLNYVI